MRFWAGPNGIVAAAARFVKHRFRPHTHDDLMLGLIEAGTKTFIRERDRHVAHTGAISIVNPGEVHTGERSAGEELRYRALYVPPTLLGLVADQIADNAAGGGIAFAAGVVRDAVAHAALLRAHAAITGREPLLARETLLLASLAHLVDRHGSRAGEARPLVAAPAAVSRARELIRARYADELSIQEVADAVGLSPFHLMRQFRRFVGLPVHAYQIQVRVEAAVKLLSAGVPSAEVAVTVGFADQSHLTRRFKDLMGAPPVAYQRTMIVRKASLSTN